MPGASFFLDDVVDDGERASWRFVTMQTHAEQGGDRLYLAGHTALPADG